MKKLMFPILSLCLLSCSNDSSDIISKSPEQDSLFSVQSMKILETVSGFYEEGDVQMQVFVDDLGFENAKFTLTGTSKENVQLGIFAQDFSTSTGTECDGSFSCGKLIKACLDSGKDALISNGPCATYCVTCQDPQK